MHSMIGQVDMIIKNLIVDSFWDSAESYKEFKLENNNATNNCYASARWDIINNEIASNLDKCNIPYSIVRTGFWSLLLFCDVKTDILFSVMRQERFKYICANPKERAPKYFDSLVSLNSDLQACNSQTTLSGFQQYCANDRYNQLDELCNRFPKPNKKFIHAVIVFGVDGSDITTIKICIVNNKFEILEEFDVIQDVVTNRIENTFDISKEQDSVKSTKKSQRGFVKLRKTNREIV